MNSKRCRHHQSDNCEADAKQREVDPLFVREKTHETRIANAHKYGGCETMHHAEGGAGGANGVVEM